jgi:hypothetical protein
MQVPSDEIDVADPRLADRRYWLRSGAPDICLRLTDPQSAGTGRGCNVTLRITEFGESSSLEASMGYHCLGILWGERLLKLLRHAGRRAGTVALYDFSQWNDPFPTPSGIEIVLEDETLSLEIDGHCFGRAAGPAIAEFFRRARLRVNYRPREAAAA